MKYLFLFLVLGAIFAGGLKISHTNYSDSDAYIIDTGASYSLVDKTTEFSIRGSHKNVRGVERISAGLGIDLYYQDEWSPFVFGSYDLNNSTGADSYRLGYGLAWWPLKNVLKFPYSHKISYALVHDHKRSEAINSFRYKFEGYHNKLGLKMTYFNLGYTANADIKLSYKVDSRIKLLNKLYWEELSGKQYFANSFGIEVNL